MPDRLTRVSPKNHQRPDDVATYLIQLHGKKYELVWPDKAATGKLQWPMAGWTK
jgi:hypothetical protein